MPSVLCKREKDPLQITIHDVMRTMHTTSEQGIQYEKHLTFLLFPLM